MPRFFAVDTKNNKAVSYIGAIDKDTGEWIDRNDELLQRVKESAHERLTRRVNEILNHDPTVPFELVDDPEQSEQK